MQLFLADARDKIPIWSPYDPHKIPMHAGDHMGEYKLAINRVLVRARRHVEQAFDRLFAQWQKASRPSSKVSFMREVVILRCGKLCTVYANESGGWYQNGDQTLFCS